jgi:hypothetical protein
VLGAIHFCRACYFCCVFIFTVVCTCRTFHFNRAALRSAFIRITCIWPFCWCWLTWHWSSQNSDGNHNKNDFLVHEVLFIFRLFKYSLNLNLNISCKIL